MFLCRTLQLDRQAWLTLHCSTHIEAALNMLSSAPSGFPLWMRLGIERTFWLVLYEASLPVMGGPAVAVGSRSGPGRESSEFRVTYALCCCAGPSHIPQTCILTLLGYFRKLRMHAHRCDSCTGSQPALLLMASRHW